MYARLDQAHAAACGDKIASFKFDRPTQDYAKEIKDSLEQSAALKAGDRLYLVWREKDGHLKGEVIVGARKIAPWEGYAAPERETVDIGD